MSYLNREVFIEHSLRIQGMSPGQQQDSNSQLNFLQLCVYPTLTVLPNLNESPDLTTPAWPRGLRWNYNTNCLRRPRGRRVARGLAKDTSCGWGRGWRRTGRGRSWGWWAATTGAMSGWRTGCPGLTPTTRWSCPPPTLLDVPRRICSGCLNVFSCIQTFPWPAD